MKRVGLATTFSRLRQEHQQKVIDRKLRATARVFADFILDQYISEPSQETFRFNAGLELPPDRTPEDVRERIGVATINYLKLLGHSAFKDVEFDPILSEQCTRLAADLDGGQRVVVTRQVADEMVSATVLADRTNKEVLYLRHDLEQFEKGQPIAA